LEAVLPDSNSCAEPLTGGDYKSQQSHKTVCELDSINMLTCPASILQHGVEAALVEQKRQKHTKHTPQPKFKPWLLYSVVE
jgi:hypothetical protein